MGERGPADAPDPGALPISVVVPTYQRPDQVMHCLDGLEAQTLQPLEILAIVRRDDRESKDALASRANGVIKIVEVAEGGIVAAMNAGLASARGAVVAFTDDDAVPRHDWLERVRAHLLGDPALGGIGGRDLLAGDPGPPASVVGRIAWYGRIVGNHHLGFGAPRQVDVLKGVNMALRVRALGDLRFDDRLLGRDMQLHHEVGLCLAVRRRGWKLIYDPGLLVDHYEAARQYSETRGSGEPANAYIEAHNELLGLATGLSSVRRAAAVAYNLIVGSRTRPGPLLALERLIVGREGWAAVRRMKAVTAGRLRALAESRRRERRR